MLFGAKHPAAQSSAQTGCWCSENFATLEPAPSLPKPISFPLNVPATGPLTDQPWVCVNSIAGDRLILLDRMSRRLHVLPCPLISSLGKGRLGACNF